MARVSRSVASWKLAIGERISKAETQVKGLRLLRVMVVMEESHRFRRNWRVARKVIWIGIGVLFAIQGGLAVAKLWASWMH